MKILITNLGLAGRTGTEVVTLYLAKTLKRLGHHPMVYTTSIGDIAREIRSHGIPVVSDLSQIMETPDAIHGHHTLETTAAALYFPETPAIFVCHDFIAWHDEAPKLPNIKRYIAISNGFRRRLTVEDGIPVDDTSVVLNAVDTDRFSVGPTLAERPRNALIFAKNTQHLQAIQSACQRLELPHDVIGTAVGRTIDRPEDLVKNYDLVFASGLSAMECMATGRAVISCDGRGLAGFVDEARYEAWRPENFGLATFTQLLTTDAALAEIQRYDATQAHQVSQRIRNEANLTNWANQFVDIYRQVQDGFTPSSGKDMTRAAADIIQRWSPTRNPPAWLHERQVLLDTIKRQSLGLMRVPLGTEISATDSTLLDLVGFHPPETWGAWSAKPNYAIRFAPEKPFSRITLKGKSYLTKDRPECRIDVSINGIAAGSQTVVDDVQYLTFDLPLLEDETTWVQIHSDEGASPIDNGRRDPRKLGFALHSIRLD